MTKKKRDWSKFNFYTIGTSGVAQRRDWERQKHAKDIIQPFMKNKPNPDFIKAYKDEPELLKRYYTKKELRENE